MSNAERQAQYEALPEDQKAGVAATLLVEGKILALRGGALAEHQLERTLADHRKAAHGMLSPAARLVVEGTLRNHGVLKLDHTPAPPGSLDWSKLDGSAAA